MGKKVVSPAAINALKESLTSIYWFKKDLKSYLFHSLSKAEILNRLDWDDYKRNVVSNLINYLASNQEKYKDVLLFLMSDIVKMKDFSHLARLEDGKEKVKVAIESVKALEKLYKSHDSLVIEQKRIVERRMMAQVQRKQKQAVNEKIK
ncbi:hypothetical protein [Bacillus wiedmannii]|uniref:hypothetical protein n=1 Tax=Bacillus wiedmannii TaxID=1890302 RepID=UPI000BF01E02|nr:hypothetical protein [Bacillus wiedmannii]PEL44844.1 hypothetical protein CN607_03795 [Bacillus wiedmannii]